jgi:Family of unknown function (DUF5996)
MPTAHPAARIAIETKRCRRAGIRIGDSVSSTHLEAQEERMTPWPDLRIADWRDTYATLQLYLQIVGKIRLALTPKTNEWWNVTLYVTPRGLTTSTMPYGERSLSIDFDFIDHQVVIVDSDGNVRKLKLAPTPVCDFHDALFAELAAIDVRVRIGSKPQECPVTTPFPEDREHASYDAAAVRRFWEALRRMEPVFQRFRARFRGKCSPVHFFWGACDLAVSRFNGRRAPPRKGKVERDAYDEEVISLGFWPGDAWTGAAEAMFYSYTVPEPPGLAQQRVRPVEASFSDKFKEFVLPYDDLRRSRDPGAAILEFAQSTYDAGATLAGWDKAGFAYPSEGAS